MNISLADSKLAACGAACARKRQQARAPIVAAQCHAGWLVSKRRRRRRRQVVEANLLQTRWEASQGSLLQRNTTSLERWVLLGALEAKVRVEGALDGDRGKDALPHQLVAHTEGRVLHTRTPHAVSMKTPHKPDHHNQRHEHDYWRAGRAQETLAGFIICWTILGSVSMLYSCAADAFDQPAGARRLTRRARHAASGGGEGARGQGRRAGQRVRAPPGAS